MMTARSARLFLVVVCLALAAGAHGGAEPGHGLGARPGTLKERAYVEARRVLVREVAPNSFARERARAEPTGMPELAALSAAARPSAVDNSALPWVPPIGNQGYQNSCVAWSAGYYYNTYTQAMDEGIDLSNGNLNHICSPAFLYPLLNDGVDEGAYLDYAMARLSVIGCSSLSLTPYSESDYTSWPSEAAWVGALDRRTVGLYSIQTNTEAALEAVKQLLANGRLAVIRIDVYGNLYYDYPNTVGGIDNQVLYCPDRRYIFGHALTLVGYDDAREYTDHRDGLVHQGAFLAANSWGASWGTENTAGDSRGFVWIAYDAFLEHRPFVWDALYTDDRADYAPAVYALVGLSHPQRGCVELLGGAGRPPDPDAVTDAALHYSGGTALGLSSSHRIAVDMTDVVSLGPDDRLANVFVALRLSPEAAVPGQIADAEFYADPDGDGRYEITSTATLPVTVQAGSVGYGFLGVFVDLTWDHWAYDDIEACFESGIVGGYPDGSYQPTSAVTRDHIAVYIARSLAGGDENVPEFAGVSSFPDVPEGFWALDYVQYAVEQNVIAGYDDGYYHPEYRVTRDQMAVYAARALVAPAGDAALADYVPAAPRDFSDIATDFWAYTYVEYCAEHGVVQGYDDGLYHPEYVVRRDQMAVYIARAFGLVS